MLEDLISRCRQQDRKAQKQVYEMLFGKMFGLCRRYVKDKEEAMEVVHNGFVKVFSKIDMYEPKWSFENWTKRIMINCALDHLRSCKTYKETISFDHIFTVGKTFNRALSNLSMEELFEMIERVSPTSRMVFNLYAIDGYTHKEIAEQLNISVGTSKWHLSSARKQLQSMIKVTPEYMALAYG